MKIRIISAIVMLIITVPLVILGGNYFKVFALLLSLAGTYEFLKIRSKDKKIPLGLQILSYVTVGALILLNTDPYSISYAFDYKIFVAMFILYLFPVVFLNDNEKYNINDALCLFGMSLFLGFAFNTILIIRNIDITYFIFICLITIITDTFAYFTGYLIGKHKLCEKISPKKTIEGSIGGSIMGTIVPVLFYVYVINGSANIWLLILIVFTLTIVGQIGDLFFSSIKRNYKEKDFSNLIPGHGGILDRLDSLIFVAITYILFIGLL